MYLYALVLYAFWGMFTPDRIPDIQSTRELPGHLDPDLPLSVDELVYNYSIEMPLMVARGGAILNGVYIWAVVFIILNTVTSLLILAPYCLVAIVIWCFGPVATFTVGWAVLHAVVIVAAAGSLALTRLWVPCTWAIFETALETEYGRDMVNKTAEPVFHTIEAIATTGQLKAYSYQGKLYNPATISIGPEEEKPLRLAIATYWLYCPSSIEGGMTLIWASGILALLVSRHLYAAVRKWVKSYFVLFKLTIAIVVLATTASPRTMSALADMATFVLTCFWYPFYFLFVKGNFKAARRYVRLAFLIASLRILNFGLETGLIAARSSSTVKGFGLKQEKIRAIWNNTIMDFARTIDNISVPNFIRSLPDRFDREAINEANRVLKDLGWPEAPDVTDQHSGIPKNADKYMHAFVGGTNIRQGIVHMELKVAEELENLKGLAPEYKRSEQFATYENELESLSRYFQENKVDIPDIKIDEIWLLVGEIFKDSRLAPFSYILKKWEKKYGLGPFWGTTTKSGKFKKLSRKKFIASIGGMANMVKLWASTFAVAHTLPPVAPVSVKSEALGPKKWMADRVRTIVGAPITHYISSTLWNFFPNHNFKFWSTNVKVGMPLNGANLSKLVLQHKGYQNHFAGDFTEFDSTLVGKVLDLIKGVRKKGFERHRDYAKICFLIDATYKGLYSMPLMTTSTGDIYAKKQGLSTGHSSTSMDNSIATPILYLGAWRSLTGLSAHEFRHYNKLSNYGDDHLLSWLSTAPATWNVDNIQKAMSRMGVGMRDEEPSHDIDKMEFLSKKWREPSFSDHAEMAAAGVNCPALIVYHDPKKLVGKCYAPAKQVNWDRFYRAKRLVSYMYLTAHHQDLYNKLYEDLERILVSNEGSILACPVPIPTYGDVLRKWYNPDSVIDEPESKDDKLSPDDVSLGVIDYSMDGLADTVVNILSTIPDILNPTIYNMGYTNYLVSLFRNHVSWPVELIRRSNSITTHTNLIATLKRTCYDFLADVDVLTTSPNNESNSALLCKHWLYMLLRGPVKTPGVFALASWADKKIGEANFVLNGHVQPFVKRFDVPWKEIFLITLIDFIPVVQVPKIITFIRIPSFSSIGESLYGMILNRIWSKVPANMKQAAASLDTIGPESPVLLIEAPTGTGKSTTFLNFVHRFYGHRYKRVILVVPRRLIVLTLTPYINQAFGLNAKMVTEGHAFYEEYKLIITTPAEVMMHDRWLTEGNLFLVDEAHVEEAPVMAVITILKAVVAPMILLTATPSDDNHSIASVHIPLQIASTWTITEALSETIDLGGSSNYSDYWKIYKSRILSIIKAKTLSKILVFVIDRAQAIDIANSTSRRACVLSSVDKVIDKDAQLYVATSVADVGLTIPDVDWVVTSNLTRKGLPSLGNTTVGLVHVPNSLVRQRRGRTGRTNNGVFTLFTFTNCSFVVDDKKWSDATIGVELLRGNIPPETVARFFPDSICSLWDKPYSRDMDTTVDLFVKGMTQWRRAMESQHQRTFKNTLDAEGLSDLWLVQGNTIPTSIVVETRDGQETQFKTKPLEIDEAFRFVVGASKWMADRLFSTNFIRLTDYLRSETISSDTFIRHWDSEEGFTPKSVENSFPADERFGRRGLPVGEYATDISKDFGFFDKKDPLQDATPKQDRKAASRSNKPKSKPAPQGPLPPGMRKTKTRKIVVDSDDE